MFLTLLSVPTRRSPTRLVAPPRAARRRCRRGTAHATRVAPAFRRVLRQVDRCTRQMERGAASDVTTGLSALLSLGGQVAPYVTKGCLQRKFIVAVKRAEFHVNLFNIVS